MLELTVDLLNCFIETMFKLNNPSTVSSTSYSRRMHFSTLHSLRANPEAEEQARLNMRLSTPFSKNNTAFAATSKLEAQPRCKEWTEK
ncbi:unnamed protein product [Trichobilharzia regenti]|nr:unnamed protein product [Trichobilharzia regenti]